MNRYYMQNCDTVRKRGGHGSTECMAVIVELGPSVPLAYQSGSLSVDGACPSSSTVFKEFPFPPLTREPQFVWGLLLPDRTLNWGQVPLV
jgi:hypothetical protein